MAPSSNLKASALYITVSSTTVNSGSLHVYDGGTANSTTVNSGGGVTANSGGAVTDIMINSGGYLDVVSSGSANSTTVNSGGSMWVVGTVNSTTVNSGGRLLVSSGGKITGQLAVSAGVIVSAYAGSVIDFDKPGIPLEHYAAGIAIIEHELVRKYHAEYVPDMQCGITPKGRRDLWSDSNHPNAAGNRIVADTILPKLRRILK